MADVKTGQILFPNVELLTWIVGSFGGFIHNNKSGEITAKLKWPVILIYIDVNKAIDDGCRYFTSLKIAARDGEAVYTGFVNEAGESHGPG